MAKLLSFTFIFLIYFARKLVKEIEEKRLVRCNLVVPKRNSHDIRDTGHNHLFISEEENSISRLFNIH